MTSGTVSDTLPMRITQRGLVHYPGAAGPPSMAGRPALRARAADQGWQIPGGAKLPTATALAEEFGCAGSDLARADPARRADRTGCLLRRDEQAGLGPGGARRAEAGLLVAA